MGRWTLVVLVVVLFAGGRWLRAELGIELSAESIQAQVSRLGWTGPAVFVGLLVFRQFLFLPSLLVLSAGGVCFGALFGTVLGALGIVISAALVFGLARGIGRSLLRPRFGQAMQTLERRVESAGPLLVGLATAHPTGPMGPIHWAAGFSTLSVAAFFVVVALAAPVRAFAYAFFGSTLLAPGTPRFYAATLLLLAVALVPLLHPRVRRRLFGRDGSDATEAPVPADQQPK
jgi:uncharacterized membrane protein YdjX (TVP38/TMEM64 family)